MKTGLQKELRKQMLRDGYFPERDIDAFCDDVTGIYGGFLESEGILFYETQESNIKDLMCFIEDMGGYQTFDYDDTCPVIFENKE